MTIAATQSAELLFLFVGLPFIVAAAVLAFVNWRWRGAPPPVRTSEILATGDTGRAEVLAIKATGGPLDGRPMVKMGLRVAVGDEPPFLLEVVQSVPRALLKQLHTGDTVDVRVTVDRANAAVVLPLD